MERSYWATKGFSNDITLWWTNIAIENGPVEIVDFPIKHGDFPWQNVSSPEGIVVDCV